MEASCFRSLDAVNGPRPPKAARETRAIDSVQASEVHASKRSTAWRVAARGERFGSRNPALTADRNICVSNPVPVVPRNAHVRKALKTTGIQVAAARRSAVARGNALGVGRSICGSSHRARLSHLGGICARRVGVGRPLQAT